MNEFQVTETAAAKTPRKRRQPKPPVIVRQVSPATLAMAKALASGRDVHTVVNTDGSVTIVNGAK